MQTTTIAKTPSGIRLHRRKVELKVIAGPDEGLTYRGAGPSITIGSAPDCDLKLNDPTVSKHHLAIDYALNGLSLRDLDSTNGVWVGPVRVQQGMVSGGTSLKLGSTAVDLSLLEEEEELALPAVTHFGDLVGESVVMRELFAGLIRAAESDITVLLEGETGTGKELIARALHQHSDRANEPYVVVDCGALTENLVASELFGHTRGSFTGADRDRVGAFEQANGGTLFLDEIGELPLALQPQLLRVLERGEIKPVGEATYKPVDVRVVAATHRDLRRAVNAGTFREDLFYRLAIARMVVPPLDDRLEDLGPIAKKLVPLIAERFDRPAPEVSDETIVRLKYRSWPGNVRELRNVLEYFVVFGHLPDNKQQPAATPAKAGDSDALLDELAQLPFRTAKDRWVRIFESHYASALLERYDGNVTTAATQGGVGRAQLFRLINKYGLRDEPKS